MTPIRIEAEDMTLTTYRTESGSLAPAGNSSVSATQGPWAAPQLRLLGEGSYNVVLGYYDENDGVSHLKVSVGDVTSGASAKISAVLKPALKIWCAPLLPLGYHSTGTAIEIQGTANPGRVVTS